MREVRAGRSLERGRGVAGAGNLANRSAVSPVRSLISLVRNGRNLPSSIEQGSFGACDYILDSSPQPESPEQLCTETSRNDAEGTAVGDPQAVEM